MKRWFPVFAILAAISSLAHSQSGRRAKEIRVPVPPSIVETHSQPQPESPPVTAEQNQEYRCTEDGSLARILEAESPDELVVSPKAADSRAEITAKPKPSYTKEARRNSVQGWVTLKVLLSNNRKVSRVKVVKRLPAGLTENAIKAACRIEFKPAIKAGKPVSQWVTAEYVFRLADSSIFGP